MALPVLNVEIIALRPPVVQSSGELMHTRVKAAAQSDVQLLHAATDCQERKPSFQGALDQGQAGAIPLRVIGLMAGGCSLAIVVRVHVEETARQQDADNALQRRREVQQIAQRRQQDGYGSARLGKGACVLVTDGVKGMPSELSHTGAQADERFSLHVC